MRRRVQFRNRTVEWSNGNQFSPVAGNYAAQRVLPIPFRLIEKAPRDIV
jgi:hypothetical protein